MPRDRQILKIDVGGTEEPPKNESVFERNLRMLREREAIGPVPGTTGAGMTGLPEPTNPIRSSPRTPLVTNREELGAWRSGMSPWTGQKDYLNPQARLVDEARIRDAKERQNAAGSEISRGDVVAEIMAAFGIGGSGVGGGGSRPDFSGYRAALTGQAEELNARIQAMYNQLAEQAGANVGRIQDIYGGAQEGIGGVYDSAAGNVQQAFGSAQQQASDQLARLGIEAAAPTVINPMALSQAQAVSGLEQGRASGQAAAERYGASAGGFGSQMAQIAQQQGTEMNAAILAALQSRLAESLAAEQSGGGGGGGGGRAPSVSDQLRILEYADEEFNRRTGTPTPEQEQWAMESQYQLNSDAARLAQSFAGDNPSPEKLQEAYTLALSLLTR